MVIYYKIIFNIKMKNIGIALLLGVTVNHANAA